MKKPRNYLEKEYGLKETVKEAFSKKTADKKELIWWINREEELQNWKEIMKKSTVLRKNFINFIIGSYGRGKTLSLFKVIDEAQKYDEIYPIYMNFKGEERSKAGLDFIFRIFKSIDFNELKKKEENTKLKESITRIPDAYQEAKTILSLIFFDQRPKKSGYQKDLFGDKKTVPIKSKYEKDTLALYFLRGEVTPTTSQLRELGIMRKIQNIDVAKEYLGVVLYFLKNLGYTTLLLAIDEFEYLFSLVPKSQHSIYIALLRGLYDFPTGSISGLNDIANMVFFVAISESGWSGLQDMKHIEKNIGGPTVPLIDRIDNTTTLGVFGATQTRELIVKRLKYNRVGRRFEDKPLIPFSEDFVKFIFEETGGEPRAIVVRTGQVLDAGLSERVVLLDRKYAQRVLAERGF